MGLSIQDWKFLREFEIGLRHIGDVGTAAVQMTTGMTGDAVPLSTAAEVIERERSGGSHEKTFMQAVTRKLFDTIADNADEFEQRLRQKLEQVITVGFSNNSSGDLGKSTFMIVTGIGKSYSNIDYEVHPDTYPLGKAGRQEIGHQQVATALILSAQDQLDIADGRKTAVGIIVDKVMETIPSLRETRALEMATDNKAQSKFAPAEQPPASEWSLETVIRDKAHQIESWFGGKGIDTLNNGQKALATMSLHAQEFIDGAIPDGKAKENLVQFAKNMKTMIAHDAEGAAQFSLAILNHPKLGALAETASESYKTAMETLKESDLGRATMLAKNHLERYADIETVAKVAATVVTVASTALPAPAKKAVSLATKAP